WRRSNPTSRDGCRRRTSRRRKRRKAPNSPRATKNRKPRKRRRSRGSSAVGAGTIYPRPAAWGRRNINAMSSSLWQEPLAAGKITWLAGSRDQRSATHERRNCHSLGGRQGRADEVGLAQGARAGLWAADDRLRRRNARSRRHPAAIDRRRLSG